MAKLTFILDDGEKVELPLTGDVSIGRVEGNDVVVDDPRISGRHAEVKKMEDGSYEVRDLSSRAGTFVNEDRVTTRTLTHGDKLTFGPLIAEFDTENQVASELVSAPAPPAEDDATAKEKEREKQNEKEADKKPSKDKEGSKEKVGGTVKGLWPWGRRDKADDKGKGKAKGKESKVEDAGAKAPAEEELIIVPKAEVRAAKSDKDLVVKAGVAGKETAAKAGDATPPVAKEEKAATPTPIEVEKPEKDAKPEVPQTEAGKPTEETTSDEKSGDEKSALQEVPELDKSSDVKSETPVVLETPAAVVPVSLEPAKPEPITGGKPSGKVPMHAPSKLAKTDKVPISPAVVPAAPVHRHVPGESRLVANPFAKLEAEAKAGIEKLQDQRRELEDELAKVREELTAQEAECAEVSQRCMEMKNAVAGEERRLNNLRSQITAGETQFRDITGQIHGGTERVVALKAEEQRLGQVGEALKDAEAKHAEWLEAITALSVDYEAKAAEVQRLNTGSTNALRELEALTANKEQMSVQLLGLLKDRETQEATLAELRKQAADTEGRHKAAQELVAIREDQGKAAERKLQTIEQQRQAAEQRLKELNETEAKLKAARTLLHESDAKQAALTAALTILGTRHKSNEDQVNALDKRLLELRQEQTSAEDRVAEARKELAAGERALEEFRAKSSATHKQMEGALADVEGKLTTRQGELSVETKKLDDARTERAELERQSQLLADTDAKLSEAKAGLQKAGAHRVELDAWIKDLEAKRIAAQNVVDGLHQDEEVTKGRLEVLRGREKDLRLQLDQLSERERSERDRFEEIRRLGVEAEKEHKGRMVELQATIDVTRRELADMEMKLAPLREWKDAMDKRYTRLASLPEDSAEARELYKEIEAEKAALRNLISVPGGGTTRSVALDEGALRSMQPAEGDAGEGDAGKGSADPTKAGGKKGKLHAPEEILDAETPQERAHVGTTGTGAMLSGTGQEMALKARLTRIRESVQREASRLEFLRQERAREETRGKAGTTAGDAMLREQERQLESKVRREEEKFAALERKIENAEMEEEKRRERIADMERKLTELRADIAVHERSRSDALHAAELARKELAGIEESVERLRTMGDGGEAFEGTKTGPVPMGPKTGPVQVGGSKLKTMVSGKQDT